MLLDKTTSVLSVTVATAISAVGLEATVEYEDTLREAVTPATVQTVLPTATTQVLGSPAISTARRVIEISIYNADNVAHDVTVLLNTLPIKFNAALAAGKTLHYNRFNGWAIV